MRFEATPKYKMKFTDDQIEIKPGHLARTWQSCNYYVGRTRLFHERSNIRSIPSNQRGPMTPAQLYFAAGAQEPNGEQWLPGSGPRAQMEKLGEKYGGYAVEEFYAEEGADSYFLAFNDTEKALAFCRTADFDKLCATMGKLED